MRTVKNRRNALLAPALDLCGVFLGLFRKFGVGAFPALANYLISRSSFYHAPTNDPGAYKVWKIIQKLKLAGFPSALSSESRTCLVFLEPEGLEVLRVSRTPRLSRGPAFTSTIIVAPKTMQISDEDSSLIEIAFSGSITWVQADSLKTAIRSLDTSFIHILRLGAQWLLQESQFRKITAELEAGFDLMWGDEEYVDPKSGKKLPIFYPHARGALPYYKFPALNYLAIRTSLTLKFLASDDAHVETLAQFVSLVNDNLEKGQGSRLYKVNRILTTSHVAPSRLPPDSLGLVSYPKSQLGSRRVSVIVPTRDKVELLRKCIQSISASSGHFELEVIVVDNDSMLEDTKEYLEALNDLGHNVLRYPGDFNYSKLNNFAASKASGEILVLLNNDVEGLEDFWLQDLVDLALRQGVGAVGAKLHFPDKSLQHIGVVVGMLGSAAHFLHKSQDSQILSPQVRGIWPTEAVTGACLVVEKWKYDLVGGLDESLAVGLNDIDFCMKLNQQNFTNYVNNDVCLTHLESASRGTKLQGTKLEKAAEEVLVFRDRWLHRGFKDRFFNSQLTLKSSLSKFK